MSTLETAGESADSAPDADRARAFEARMVDALNASGLCMMTSLGHRTGLFETMQGMQPATSSEIAERADLEERYVREWLGAMTVGRVVDYDPDRDTYHLPEEHAALLTPDAGADNLAMFTQWVSLLGSAEDDVAECFHQGGGVPYDEYDRFHEVMAEESALTLVPMLREEILGLVPGLDSRLEEGIRVLDLGCGRGQAINLMAEWFPASEFVGVDLSEEAIEYARGRAEDKGLSNVEFVRQDLSTFDEDAEPNAFELVATFDAVHDQPRPEALLRGIVKTLTKDGVYLAQDIDASRDVEKNMDHPLGTILYATSTLHCMTVSLAQGGPGLGTMWGRETAREMFREAGFRDVEVHELEGDIQNCYFVCRP